MSNLDTITTWRTWSETNPSPSETSPSEGANVDFWFAEGGDTPNRHLHRFADTANGSLLAVWSDDGDFTAGPVVLLGHEGGLTVLGEDVETALMVVAGAGEEPLDDALAYGPAGEPDAALRAWLVERGVGVVEDIRAHVAALTETHSAIVERLGAINDGR